MFCRESGCRPKLTGLVDCAASVDEAALIAGAASIDGAAFVAMGSVTVIVVGVAFIWTACASSADAQRSGGGACQKRYITMAQKRSVMRKYVPLHLSTSRS